MASAHILRVSRPESRLRAKPFASSPKKANTLAFFHRQKKTPLKRGLFLPMTGHLSNHFVEGMRKIYELEPFIEMGPLPSEGLNTGPKRYKKAC
jgi:hypothetical protein